MNLDPFLIEFKSIGSSALGYISVAEQLNEVPFLIERVYWTYYTPENVERGGHANIEKQLVLVAVSGSITIETETKEGKIAVFKLTHPREGIFLPPLCWHKMKYSHNAVQMVIASNCYSENDYIREYDVFKNLVR